MVEWGVCGEGKEWEGLCVGMPSIARAAAGNDANPRLQPATSQTDNEHDASLRRRIPPLAIILPCCRHQVNHPAGFPAMDRPPPTGTRPPLVKKSFFALRSSSLRACPARPKTGKEKDSPGKPVPGMWQAACGKAPAEKRSPANDQPVTPLCRAVSVRYGSPLDPACRIWHTGATGIAPSQKRNGGYR